MRATYKTTRNGERVIFGPATDVIPGHQVLVQVSASTGQLQPERPVRVGRTFMVNGVEMVYGYLRPDRRQSARRQSGSPRHTSYSGGFCAACVDIEDMGDGQGCSRHRGNPR